MNKNSISISKRLLWRHINKKINGTINHLHVFSIICILFEEIFNDLKQRKEINIMNFGKFIIKDMKPRRYHNVWKMQVMQSDGYPILRFLLSELVRKKILEHLDADKTFSGDI